MESLKKVISLHQAAKISGYTQDHLGYLIRSGEIKGVKKGRNWFTSKDEVKSYLLKQKTIHAQSSNKGSVKKILHKKLAVKSFFTHNFTHNFTRNFTHNFTRNILVLVIIAFVALPSLGFYSFVFSRHTEEVKANKIVAQEKIPASLLSASVLDSFTSVSSGLADGWVTFTEGILNNIKDSANGTKEFAISVWDGATFVGSGITNGITSTPSVIARVITYVGNSLTSVSNGLAFGWNSLTSIPSKIASNWNSFLAILSTPKPKTITVIPPSLTTTALTIKIKVIAPEQPSTSTTGTFVAGRTIIQKIYEQPQTTIINQVDPTIFTRIEGIELALQNSITHDSRQTDRTYDSVSRSVSGASENITEDGTLNDTTLNRPTLSGITTLNGAVTLDNSFSQTGANTFSTGTGAISLNGPVAGFTMGGTLAMGTNNITSTGSLGATGAGKLTKGWFTDLEVSNDIIGNVTGTAGNIAGGVGGEILYQSASNTTGRLGNGTAGQVLTSQGTTLAPQWTTLSGGGMVYPGVGIAISTGSAWGASITNNSANWNTAYSQTRQWDGGSTGLVVATGRTSLGLGSAALNNTGDFATATHNHTGVYAPVLGVDDNYVTDAQIILLGNTSGTNTGDNSANSSSQPVDSDLTTIAGLTATTGNIIQSVGSAWASQTPTQVTATLLSMTGDSGAGGLKGLVPAQAIGDATKFLTGAGTWGTPAGVGDMVLASVQTVSGAKTFNDTKLLLRNVANTFNGSFVNTNTVDRVYTLKDASGTLAFTSDITGTNSGTNTGDNSANSSSQPVDSDLTTIAGLTATTGNIIQSVGSAWASQTPT
ncbi:MAG: helix-turn-helix domain-containing protein, partial [Candidatus Paceibacterota bacterium]